MRPEPGAAPFGLSRNILVDIADEKSEPLHSHDNEIMALTVHRAAVTEVGEDHHDLHGRVALARDSTKGLTW